MTEDRLPLAELLAKAGDGDFLRSVAEKPDITGRALLAELQARQVGVSYFAVWNFLDHAGLTYKKKRCTPVSKTATTLPGAAGYGSACRARLMPPG